MSLRIWILNHHAIPPSMPGGTRHFDMAKELVSIGHSVTIFASSFHYATLREMKTYNGASHLAEDIQGVRFVWIKTPPYSGNNFRRILNMVAYYRAVGRLGKETVSVPDVIIGSTVHPLAPIAAAKLAAFHKVPFIYEIRDLWPQTFIDIGVWSEQSLQSRFFRWLEKRAYNRAKAVIALSPLTVDYLRLNYGEKLVKYIPNGVNLALFDQKSTEKQDHPTLFRIAELRSAGKFIIMFTGALVMSNQLDTILSAAKILIKQGQSEINIVLVGGGQDKDRIQNEIKNAQLKNVEVLDPVQKNSVSSLLRLADALMLVQGKVFYGSTNKLADYMAASRPLITAISVQHNDPVTEAACGISVHPENPGEMAGGMIEMYQVSEEVRTKMGQNGRKFAEKHLSIQKLSRQLESLCISIVGK